MPPSMVPVHRFRAYRLLRDGEAPPPTPQHDYLNPDQVADLVESLSAEAKLGPVIPIPGCVIIGSLSGFIGIELEAPLVAPVGAQLPPPPRGPGKRA